MEFPEMEFILGQFLDKEFLKIILVWSFPMWCFRMEFILMEFYNKKFHKMTTVWSFLNYPDLEKLHISKLHQIWRNPILGYSIRVI